MDIRLWAEKLVQGQDLPLDIPQDKASLGGMYLGDALKAHINWRVNWLDALKEHRDSEYDVAQVAADNLCKVGLWLYSNEGRKFAALPEYEELKKAHAQFHLCAGEIVKLHKNGQFLEAFQMAKNKLMEISVVVANDFVNLLQSAQTRGLA